MKELFKRKTGQDKEPEIPPELRRLIGETVRKTLPNIRVHSGKLPGELLQQLENDETNDKRGTNR